MVNQAAIDSVGYVPRTNINKSNVHWTNIFLSSLFLDFVDFVDAFRSRWFFRNNLSIESFWKGNCYLKLFQSNGVNRLEWFHCLIYNWFRLRFDWIKDKINSLTFNHFHRHREILEKCKHPFSLLPLSPIKIICTRARLLIYSRKKIGKKIFLKNESDSFFTFSSICRRNYSHAISQDSSFPPKWENYAFAFYERPTTSFRSSFRLLSFVLLRDRTKVSKSSPSCIPGGYQRTPP